MARLRFVPSLVVPLWVCAPLVLGLQRDSSPPLRVATYNLLSAGREGRLFHICSDTFLAGIQLRHRVHSTEKLVKWNCAAHMEDGIRYEDFVDDCKM